MDKKISIENLDTVEKNVSLEEFVIRRIDELCKVNGMSKYRLGMMTGVAQSSLSTMMSGKTLPSLGTLDKLCEGLGISIFDFFNVDTEKVSFKSQETMLLRHWHKLDSHQKAMVLAFAKGMLANRDLDELKE